MTDVEAPQQRKLGKELDKLLNYGDDLISHNVEEQAGLLDLYNRSYLNYGEDIADMLRGERLQDVGTAFGQQQRLLQRAPQVQASINRINPQWGSALTQATRATNNYWPSTRSGQASLNRTANQFANWNDPSGRFLRGITGSMSNYVNRRGPEWQWLNRSVGQIQNFAGGRGREWDRLTGIDNAVRSYIGEYRGSRLPAIFGDAQRDSSLLSQVAREELSKRGALSVQEIEDVSQATRRAMAERGMISSNPAIFAEALNRDEFQRQRLQERQAAAERAAGIATNLAGTATGAEAQALGLGLQSSSTLLQARLNALGLGLQAAETGNQIRQGALGLGSQFGGVLASRGAAGVQAAATRAASERERATGRATLAMQNANLQQNALAPTLGFYGNTSAATPPVINPNVASSLGPLLGYSQDLFNTNLNADAATKNAQANADAGFYSGIVQGGAALGGAAMLAFCWVARACLESHEWRKFRRWMLEDGPDWLVEWYGRHGEEFAARLHNKPRIRAAIASWMRLIITIEERKALA